MNNRLFFITHLSETTSTNDEVKRLLVSNTAKYIVAATSFQTAGRGQQGNHWESRSGQNLLYSIGVRPSFLPPRKQFRLLQVASLAVCNALNDISEGFKIKWPNDIYFNDCKISGTLIENELCGQNFKQCILGTGININQTDFSTYPPNPISLKQIIGRDLNPAILLEQILHHFDKLYQQLEQGDEFQLAAAYRAHLFRGEGQFPYRDVEGTFKASVQTIEPDGHLVLLSSSGDLKRYYFKEVKFIFKEMESN